jgi:hypothetical protein
VEAREASMTDKANPSVKLRPLLSSDPIYSEGYIGYYVITKDVYDSSPLFRIGCEMSSILQASKLPSSL